MIPFQSPAEASSLFGAKGGLKSESLLISAAGDDNCAKGANLGGPGGEQGCKSDSTKKSPMDPDRKGHKVKKKSRR